MFLHLITYASLVTFALAVGVRAYRIFSMPPHLRWELYPVAHDKNASYGGSYLEELNWWEKPRYNSFLGMLKGMIPEMIFIKALFVHNRPLWYRSFPFHFGLYILIGFLGLIGFSALLLLAGAGFNGGISGFIGTVTAGVGWVGLGMATAGAAALLHRRLTDEDLKDYTRFSHLFNLGFILATLLITMLTFVVADRSFALLRGYVAALLSFQTAAPVGSSLVAIAIFLGSLLIAYIPLTHMSHFFTKWFMWDKIRWDDEPMTKGCAMEPLVNECLQQTVTWSGPHLKADGKKNWIDIATEEMK
jgi:nitrate reductase gamma subunit